MYTPNHYKVDDLQTIRSFIKQYNFGILTSFTNSFQITHLPFLLEEKEPLVLLSHMARANPHWESFTTSPEVLVIFQGPHAYISPAFYKEKINVPTWNYAVVHAYGRAKLINDVEVILEKTIRAFDTDYLSQYLALPEEYKGALRKGIVGFEVEVERVEAKFKMHQNKSKTDRAKIIKEFSESGDTMLADVAKYMQWSLSLESET